MKKLNLGLENLTVESFDTTPAFRRSMGTVRGHMPGGVLLAADTGGGDDTCDTGCGGTWYESCEATCHACIQHSDATCYGDTCFGASCGGPGSCSQGCHTQTAC